MNPGRLRTGWLLAVVISAQLAPAQAPPELPGGLVVHEESLGKLLPGADAYSLTVDAHFQRAAYVVQRDGKEIAVVDGVEGKPYDKVAEKNEMYFSPDGKRLAYVARRGDKKLVVVDGVEGKEYDEIYDLFNPIFSPDSKQVAYIATTSDKLKQKLGLWDVTDFVVVNGVESKAYQSVESITFSPDSKKLAFHAERAWNRGMCLVVNGVEGKQYGGISGVTFSPDSSRIAFAAFKWNPDRSLAVIDGVDGPEFQGSAEAIPGVVFSPDSKHTAYPVASRRTLVRDGVPFKRFRPMSAHGPPVFSPDSRHLAYVAQETNWMIVLDDKVFDDQNVRQFTADLTFSPDSQHLAYITRFDSPTNTGYDFVVLDGAVQEGSKNVYTAPYFTPDGTRLAYIIRSENNKETLVYGQFHGAEYDRFIPCYPDLNRRPFMSRWTIPFAFDKDGTLHAIAIRGGEIFHLELKIPDK